MLFILFGFVFCNHQTFLVVRNCTLFLIVHFSIDNQLFS